MINTEVANPPAKSAPKVIVIGGGPAGLIAAEVLSTRGVQVDLYDAMPSVGRKFLLAGKGGLNLTHAEGVAAFESRYGHRSAHVKPWLQGFGAQAVRDWAKALGVHTFVGTSGRVFPSSMKAAPLLRAWLHRLRHSGVTFHMRHRWVGWAEAVAAASESQTHAVGADDAPCSRAHTLYFNTPNGRVQASTDAVVLALGGGSWARLGSDGAWVEWLASRGVPIVPLKPSNCGFDVLNGWSEHFASRFAGQPFKLVSIRFEAADGSVFEKKGEFVATATGVEGSLIYAASAALREEIAKHGAAHLTLDLLPDFSADKVRSEVLHPRGSRSLSSHLKSRLGIDGIKSALLHECLSKADLAQADKLAAALKAIPITLSAPRPLDEAISSAGGVAFEGLNDALMLTHLTGVFCAGEMLDWEAPTGGYLLTACFASGQHAAQGVLAHLNR